MNVWEAMQQELVNLYQFLYHVTPVVIFQVKSWPDLKRNMEIQVSSCSIRKEDSVKLLRTHINNNLNFNYHVNQLCKKASKNFHALARIAKYIDINKWRMLMKAFVSSQFSYCLLIWMFHSRKMEHRTKSIHKRV